MFKENEKPRNQVLARPRRQKEVRPDSAAHLADTCPRISALWAELICSRVGLVVELERVIGVREVLVRLSFDFSVGFNPVKKLGALARVFLHRRL